MALREGQQTRQATEQTTPRQQDRIANPTVTEKVFEQPVAATPNQTPSVRSELGGGIDNDDERLPVVDFGEEQTRFRPPVATPSEVLGGGDDLL